jgi:putative transposase
VTEIEGIHTGRHRILAMHAHLAFLTKFRHQVFTDRHLTRRQAIMPDVCQDFQAQPVEYNGDNNHVHRLINYPPKVAVVRPANSLKDISPRRLRHEFPDLARHYDQANELSSGSYLAGSAGGAPLSMVKQYIQQQNHPA